MIVVVHELLFITKRSFSQERKGIHSDRCLGRFSQTSIHGNILVEAPVPDHGPIGNLEDTRIFIMLRLNFDHVGTNSVMTHIMVLSAKVKRIEQLQ